MSTPAGLNNTGNVHAIGENKAIKKHKKKSKKRKRSDPAVTNISLLLSGGLNLISPESKASGSVKRQTSLPQETRYSNEKNETENNDTSSKVRDKSVLSPVLNCKIPNEEMCSEVELGVSVSESVNENATKLQSKNVFKFMMDNRNKSIGRNSPGKERDVNTNLVSNENKEKLVARKVLFEKWAVLKGSNKYKAEEKEREIYINRKLAKRKRKLKKMLSLSGSAGIVVSDSENSQDTRINEVENKKLIANQGDCRITISDDEKSSDNRDKLRGQINKDNPNNNKKNENSLRKSCDIKNLKNNVGSQRNSLDNFLGISASKSIKRKLTEEDDDDDDDIEFEDDLSEAKDDIIKIKMFSPKVFKRRKRIFIMNNTQDSQPIEKEEEFCALKKKCAENSPKKRSSRHFKNTNNKEPNSNSDILCTDEKSDITEIIEITETEKLPLKQSKALKSNRKDRRSRLLEEHKAIDLSTTDDSSNDSISLVSDSENYPRRSLRTRKNKSLTYNERIVTYLDCEDSNDKRKNKTDSAKNKKVVKLAPIFLQTKPKVKLDPAVLEARKQFLMSGIPEALKRTMEKQQSLIEAEPNLFPEISHVQQRSTVKHDIDYWNLPEVKLNLVDADISLPQLKYLSRGTLNVFPNLNNENCEINLYPPEKIKNLKPVLLEIKKNNPDYPVYRSYRLLKEKAVHLKAEDTPIKKKKKRRSRNSKKESKSEMDVSSSFQSSMWIEKYKAATSEDIIGNQNSVSELKKWLECWVEATENKAIKSKQGDSSSSEFDCDSRSCDSTSPGNALMVHGPHGSGKTMTIYALCNELGINVLELNASSKRTGKRLLQELQEATQSHQVRKRDKLDLNNFLKSADSKNENNSSNVKDSTNKHSKMCLLLVEDVDVVFEQDDGFLSALTQLLSSSKRPIILIATDISSPNLQKVVSHSRLIHFSPLTPKVLTVWLQILCLLEGYFVNKESLTELLEWNRGDARKTLLQLQFWVQSGGGSFKDISLKITKEVTTNAEVVLLNDDTQLSIEEVNEDKDTVPMHSNCLSSFVNDRLITLDNVWWNSPRNSSCSNIDPTKSQAEVTISELQKILNCLEVTAEIDRKQRRCGLIENSELSVKNSSLEIQDSIELLEVFDDSDAKRHFVNDWTHELIFGCKRLREDSSELNLSLPALEDRRRRIKQRACKTKYMGIVPLSYCADRRALTLDYYPSLRTITRSEQLRFVNSQKRNNRFFNYLRNLGFHGSESTTEIACNALYANCCHCEDT